jgi:hypothetical protein
MIIIIRYYVVYKPDMTLSSFVSILCLLIVTIIL